VLGWYKCVSCADVATTAYETQLRSLTFNLFFCIIFIVIPDVKKKNEFVVSLLTNLLCYFYSDSRCKEKERIRLQYAPKLELSETLLRMVVRRGLLRRSHTVAGDCTLLDTGSWRS
jgi:hypothetical protein